MCLSVSIVQRSLHEWMKTTDNHFTFLLRFSSFIPIFVFRYFGIPQNWMTVGRAGAVNDDKTGFLFAIHFQKLYIYTVESRIGFMYIHLTKVCFSRFWISSISLSRNSIINEKLTQMEIQFK